MEIILILYNIRSVYNVASIFRTADAAHSAGSGQAGVSKVYLVGVTPTPFDKLGNFRKDFSKVALGAEKSVTWEKRHAISTLLKELKTQGYEILAVEQDKRAIPYYSFHETRDMRQVRERTSKKRQETRRKKKMALVFGEETKGLPRSVLDKCDQILEIPMRGTMVREDQHPKNKKSFSAEAPRRAGSTKFTTSRGKESLNVSVAAGIVIYSLIFSLKN